MSMHNFDVAITNGSSMFQLLQSNQKHKKGNYFTYN